MCLIAFVRRPPEISIEWSDVTIEIKVCAPEIQPEERSFVKWVKILTYIKTQILVLSTDIILSWTHLFSVLMT